MSRDTQIAVMQTKLDDIKTEIVDIKVAMKDIVKQYITRDEAQAKLIALNEQLSERIKRLETIVFGMIGLILTGFMGALITMVYRK